ncbi:hypothetical protein LENED_005919 [Lentinula edodes]|uniref:Uncharacterized protein n=1 Tax=Lentinula edodes TaxID=5353 RepID=A0A1Q3EAI6_LENED|nr:hypothetical protein LENED_005919 [Lentinula edodes]
MVSSSRGSSPKLAGVEVRGVEETDWDTTYAIEGSVSDCARDEGPGRTAMLILSVNLSYKDLAFLFGLTTGSADVLLFSFHESNDVHLPDLLVK